MDENPMDPISDNTIDVDAVNNADVEEAKPADVLLTAAGQKFLNQTRPWVRFLSIMIFIGAGFMLIAGLMAFLIEITGSLLNTGIESFDQLPGGGLFIGILYMIFAVLYFPPGIFISRYAKAIKILESERTSASLEKALKYQRSFWRYVGILVVASLIVTAAVIAFSFIVVFSMFLNR